MADLTFHHGLEKRQDEITGNAKNVLNTQLVQTRQQIIRYGHGVKVAAYFTLSAGKFVGGQIHIVHGCPDVFVRPR